MRIFSSCSCGSNNGFRVFDDEEEECSILVRDTLEGNKRYEDRKERV